MFLRLYWIPEFDADVAFYGLEIHVGSIDLLRVGVLNEYQFVILKVLNLGSRV
jgi:hypothetical protein